MRRPSGAFVATAIYVSLAIAVVGLVIRPRVDPVDTLSKVQQPGTMILSSNQYVNALLPDSDLLADTSFDTEPYQTFSSVPFTRWDDECTIADQKWGRNLGVVPSESMESKVPLDNFNLVESLYPYIGVSASIVDTLSQVTQEYQKSCDAPGLTTILKVHPTDKVLSTEFALEITQSPRNPQPGVRQFHLISLLAVTRGTVVAITQRYYTQRQIMPLDDQREILSKAVDRANVS